MRRILFLLNILLFAVLKGYSTDPLIKIKSIDCFGSLAKKDSDMGGWYIPSGDILYLSNYNVNSTYFYIPKSILVYGNIVETNEYSEGIDVNVAYGKTDISNILHFSGSSDNSVSSEMYMFSGAQVYGTIELLPPPAPRIVVNDTQNKHVTAITSGENTSYTVCDCSCSTTFETGYQDDGMTYTWIIKKTDGTPFGNPILTDTPRLTVNLKELTNGFLGGITVEFKPSSNKFPAGSEFPTSRLLSATVKAQPLLIPLTNSNRKVDIYPSFDSSTKTFSSWVAIYNGANFNNGPSIQQGDNRIVAAEVDNPETSIPNRYRFIMNGNYNNNQNVEFRVNNAEENIKSCFDSVTIQKDLVNNSPIFCFNISKSNDKTVNENSIIPLCQGENTVYITTNRGQRIEIFKDENFINKYDLFYTQSDLYEKFKTISFTPESGNNIYTIKFTDYGGNIHTRIINIARPVPNTKFTTADRTCNNPINGAINLPVNSGWSTDMLEIKKGSSIVSPTDYSKLEAGEYNISYKYTHTQSGCSVTGSTPLTINDKDMSKDPVVTISKTDNTCSGKVNGSISLSTTPPDWIFLNEFCSIGGVTAISRNDLSKGSYEVKYALKKGGCLYSNQTTRSISDAILVNSSSMTISPVAVDKKYNVSCKNDTKSVLIQTPNNNKLVLLLTKGADAISGNNNSYNLRAGSYNAKLTYVDTGLCPDKYDYSFSVEEPAPLTITHGNTIYNCSANNATINYTVSNNNYTAKIYKKNNVGSFTNPDIINCTSNTFSKDLIPGEYKIEFTRNNCTHVDYDNTFIIYNNITLPDYSDKTISTTNCEKKPIVLNPNGGSGSYIIEKKEGNSYTSLTTNQRVGAYIVRVKDNQTGCTTNDVKVTVGASSIPELLNVSTKVSPACINGDVQVTLTKRGGDNTQLSTAQGYAITNSNGGNIYNIAIAGQATYPSTVKVIAKDLTTGCSVEQDITIDNLKLGLALDESHVRASCLNNDGKITLTASGGSGSNYTYKCLKVDDGKEIKPIIGNSTIFEGLSPATYECTVNNNSVCTASKKIIIKSLFDDLKTSAVNAQEVSCFGASNGIIDISLTGVDESMMLKDIILKRNNSIVEAKPYDKKNSTFRFSGLLAGVYTYSITSNLSDACSKEVTEGITITQPSPMVFGEVVTTPRVVDYKNNITGGTIAFKVENAAGQITVDEVGKPFVKNGESKIIINSTTHEGNIENLGEGNYTLTASYKCSNIPNNSTPNPITITISTIKPTFYKSITHPANDTRNNGVFTLTNGSKYSDTGLHYNITIYSGQTIKEEVKDIDFNFISHDIKLLTGDYRIKITIPEKGNLVVWDETFSINPVLIATVDPAKTTKRICYGATFPIADVKSLLNIKDGAGTGDFDIVEFKENSSSAWSPVSINTRLGKGFYKFRIKEKITNTIAETSNSLNIDVPQSGISVRFSLPSPYTVKCNGFTSDPIIGTISGGWPGYKDAAIGGENLTISSSNFSFTKGVGRYNITLKDGEGCESNTDYIINQPDPLTLSIAPESRMDLQCDKTNTGKVILVGQGGTHFDNKTYSYSYLLNNVETLVGSNNSIENLGTGLYTFKVIDKNGCINELKGQAITGGYIPQNSGFAIEPSDVDCFGNTTGSIALANSCSSFTYTVFGQKDPTVHQLLNGKFSNLKADKYTVKWITNSNYKCEDSVLVEVKEPTRLELTFTAKNACKNEANGKITYTIKGGTIPYTISINDEKATSSYAPYSAYKDGLAPRIYALKIVDKNKCEKNENIPIVPVPDVAFSKSVLQNACEGNNGSVKIAANSNNVGWQFFYNLFGSWVSDNTTYPSTFEKQNLSAGSYIAKGYDKESGCLVAQIQPEAAVQIQKAVKISSVTPMGTIRCADDKIGITVTLDANSNGGGNSISYSYRIKGSNSNFIPIADISKQTFGKGCYEVKAETSFCSDIKEFTVEGPSDPLSLMVTPKVILNGYHLKCNGDSDASVNLSGNGGWNTAYQYAIYNDDPQKMFWSTSNQIGGLKAGNYRFSIKDAGGCMVTSDNVSINEAEKINPEIVGISEILKNGSQSSTVRIMVGKGLAPYHISVGSNPSVGADDVLENTEQALSVAGIGNKSVVITDKLGCVATSNITLDGSYNIFAGTVTNNPCKGDSKGNIAISLLDQHNVYSMSASLNGSVYVANKSNEFNNLKQGNYLVTLTRGNHLYSQSFEIKEPVSSLTLFAKPITIKSINGVDYHLTCSGGSDGKVDLTVAGGWGGYQYASVESDVWSSVPSLNALKAGKHTFKVKDAQGCTLTSEPVVLNESISLPTFEVLAKEQTSTNGSVSNLLSLKPSGGVPTYSMELKGVEPKPRTSVGSGDKVDFRFNSIGEFSAILTDQLGCQHAEKFGFEGVYKRILFDKTVTDVTCAGKSTGRIAISNPQGAYIYRLIKDGVSYPMKDMAFDGLAQGWYDLEVTDSEFTYKATLEVKELGKRITLDASPSEVGRIDGTAYNIACSGDHSGKVNLTASNGYSGYSYRIAGGGDQWSSSSTFDRLSAGKYTFEVMDGNGCLGLSDLVQINELPTKPSIEIVDKSQKFVYGSILQGLSAHAKGGRPDYIFTFEGVDGQRSNVAENSNVDYSFDKKGSFTLKVTDSFGCTVDKPLDFEGADQKIIFKKAVHPVSCYGGNDGKIELSDLQDSYSIELRTGGDVLTGAGYSYDKLSSGTYEIGASIGEFLYKERVVLNEPDKLSYTAKVDPSCHNTLTGKITVSSNNNSGANSYSFSLVKDGTPMASKISGMTDGFTFDNLAEGNYKIIATNTKDYCKDSDTYTVNGLTIQKLEPLTYSLDAQHSCNSIQAQVKGNFVIGSRTFDLDLEHLNPAGNEWVSEKRVQVSGSVSSVALPVSPGVYRFKTTDANFGCLDYTNSIEVYPAPQITKAIVKDEICYGTKGMLTAAATGGSGKLSLYVGIKDFFSLFKDTTYLAPENYTLKVVDDETGCTLVRKGGLVINGAAEPFKFNITPSLYGSYNIDCSGSRTGRMAVNLTGGGVLEAVTYGDSKFTTRKFSLEELSSGWHRFTASDSFGCTIKDSIELKQPLPLNLAMAESTLNLGCSNAKGGMVKLLASGGAGGYLYSINQQPFAEVRNFENLAVGAYGFRVKDSNGCISQLNTSVDTKFTPFDLHLDVQNVTCFGANNGRVSAVTEGGATYAYKWHSDGSFGTELTKLSPGTYGVTATTVNGCSKDLFAQITQPEKLSFSFTAKSACPGEVNGVVNFDATGGTKPYTFLLNDKPFGSIGKDISAAYGLYIAKVVDANGCMEMQSLDIGKKEGSIAANFLVATTSATSDTLVLVDVCNPMPDRIKWDFSNDGSPIRRINPEEDVAPLVRFEKEGDYRIGMTAFYGDCEYTVSKVISVKNGVVSDGTKTFVFGARGIKHFEVFPNPSKGVSKFRIMLYQPQEVVLQILNLLGQQVSVQELPSSSITEGTIELNPSTPGAYIVRVMLKNKKDYREVKVVVQ